MNTNFFCLFLGGLSYEPLCKSIGKGSNVVVTSSPMTVQDPGPVSPPANQFSAECNQINPSVRRSMDASSLSAPSSDARSQVTFLYSVR